MRLALIGTLALLMAACQSQPEHPPIRTVENLDLDRFMGDWYVIANIPTPPEKDAYNAVESYERLGPNKVGVTFTFNEGGFDGEREKMTPTGFVSERDNAIWKMQFFWPLRADYRVVYVDDQYQTTLIGRQKRDYLWIMARDPNPDEATLRRLYDIAADAGYDTDKIQRVPQRW
ncbi:lipocalin family protein [Alcanivorax marinus]|uniref:Outer membrane lipoprotein Blc n=1 Tax=Alloalcanivorax marinus TaxID=1177169 RepID=A0A9Q3UKU6_9GAMM|nr:lipocalin family protein [Alloalcanivorax marinus]MCC4308045.1 lipocalin family protein [Alloalcanivorax marinus]MCU5788422.1 outer membrane lipoprotein Blc [Alloalcanivorax marinus]